MIKNTFKKIERLSGRTTIDELFSSDKSFFCYPYKVVIRILPQGEDVEVPCRVIVNVPKRNHKRAVMRNKLRRRVKEAYRLHKNELFENLGTQQIHIAILYTAKDDIPFQTLNERWAVALPKLYKVLEDSVS